MGYSLDIVIDYQSLSKKYREAKMSFRSRNEALYNELKKLYIKNCNDKNLTVDEVRQFKTIHKTLLDVLEG